MSIQLAKQREDEARVARQREAAQIQVAKVSVFNRFLVSTVKVRLSECICWVVILSTCFIFID